MGALWEGLKELLAGTLSFFYDLIPSFGLGIILLTIAINLLLFPLTLKQTRATRAFQAIQPEIKRIQKEYKDKPEELQKELMRAQREAGASPGGCLIPLIVQMPIWFALFRVLSQIPIQAEQLSSHFIEQVRRFLPSVGEGDVISSILAYLPDASALGRAVADGMTDFLGMHLSLSPGQAFSDGGFFGALPYFLMMILMVASQYFQTWHSTYGQEKPQGPQAGAQQMMTKVMPLFIGFISWNFPAGLVLYWATANLFRLGQQIVIFRIDGRPTPVSNGEADSKPSDEEADSKKPQPGSKKKQGRRRRS